MSEENKDGTIIEFLLGEKSFEGIWFGDRHPINKGAFWWRTYLRNYIKEREKVLISAIKEEIEIIKLQRDINHESKIEGLEQALKVIKEGNKK